MEIRVEINRAVEPPPPTVTYKGWRVKHKIEGGSQNTPPKRPEVTPPINAGVVVMTEAVQRMSYALMLKFNKTISQKQWTAVHAHDRAFNNNSGFGDPADPRCNYITGESLKSPLPRYDKAQRVCGGSFITGVAVGDKLVCKSGMDGIDPSNIPDIDTIINNNWYIYAVSASSDFTAISHFPQGNGGPVVIPFIFSGTIEFPLSYFERWESDTLPNPLKIYL
jgi:hypothetical protein